jgi:hypothetical protein
MSHWTLLTWWKPAGWTRERNSMEEFDLSKVIWKKVLEQAPAQMVDFPAIWRPLSFANQGGDACLWFEAEKTSEPKPHIVYLVFTGEAVPENAKFVGTALFGVGGMFVVHCYVR